MNTNTVLGKEWTSIRRKSTMQKGDVVERKDGVYRLAEFAKCSDGSSIGLWIRQEKIEK